jgi:2-polyprenyl-3-methyl-5-hydroxy-6-metoxy-1,4-benzoquinol methylase
LTNWQSKLYEAYVSTGQAAMRSSRIRLTDYPQHVRVIKKYVPADRSIKIVDLACGHGTLVFCLRELGYDHAEGVDVSPEQVALAHRLGIPEVRLGGLGDFIQDKKAMYDVIFLMDILEHLDKQSVMDVLERVREGLKDGGRLIIHVPNGEGRFGMRVRYGDFTHQGCFTRRSMQQVLSASGFGSIAAYEEKPLVHGAKSFVRRLLWSSLTLSDRLLLLAETGTWNHILSQNMLVVADK